MTTLPPNLLDQLPADLRLQQAAIHRLQIHLHRFGYEWVDTPLVEQADLFLIKAGDAAISRLLSFDLPGYTLCLRPEFTAPAARLYIDHFQDQPGPVRLQFAGPILRYESLSHGEIVQQNAVGAELLNMDGPAADAEVIALTAQMLSDAGGPAYTLHIGHSGLIERFLDRYDLNRQMRRFVLEWLPALRKDPSGLERACDALDQQVVRTAASGRLAASQDAEAALAALLKAVPQRGPSGGRAREEVARRLLSKQQQHDQHDKARRALQDFQQLLHQASTPQALLAHLLDNPLQPVARQIVDTFALLEAYGLNTGDIVFDLSFTRNLDYYTGIVFEYRTTTQDGDLLLGGGGRYDELVGLLGARNRVPAVGFMVLVNNILNAGAARQNGKVTVPLHLLVQTQLSGDVSPMIEMASGLRAAGLTVTTHLMTGQAPSPDQPFTHILTMEAPDRVCLVNPADNTPITFDRRDLPGLLAALEKRS